MVCGGEWVLVPVSVTTILSISGLRLLMASNYEVIQLEAEGGYEDESQEAGRRR
jgi:hypothetical protein